MSSQGKLAIRFTHGRRTPTENLEGGWGTTGPTIPIDWFSWVYGVTLTISREGREEELRLVEDCICWEGTYYGDFEIISVEEARQRGWLPADAGLTCATADIENPVTQARLLELNDQRARDDGETARFYRTMAEAQ
jgi:hypothetical protein